MALTSRQAFGEGAGSEARHRAHFGRAAALPCDTLFVDGALVARAARRCVGQGHVLAAAQRVAAVRRARLAVCNSQQSNQDLAS